MYKVILCNGILFCVHAQNSGKCVYTHEETRNLNIGFLCYCFTKYQSLFHFSNLTDELNKVAQEEDAILTKCNEKREEFREQNNTYQNKKKECSVLETRIVKLNENLKACETEINKFIK